MLDLVFVFLCIYFACFAFSNLYDHCSLCICHVTPGLTVNCPSALQDDTPLTKRRHSPAADAGELLACVDHLQQTRLHLFAEPPHAAVVVRPYRNTACDAQTQSVSADWQE